MTVIYTEWDTVVSLHAEFSVAYSLSSRLNSSLLKSMLT
jgi:hypothetical protein